MPVSPTEVNAVNSQLDHSLLFSVYASSNQADTMEDEVDMDAPQISTLRDDTSPEPHPARMKPRVKLLVGEKSEGSKASTPSVKRARPESEEDDEEEEEDQLIDDEEEEPPKTITIAATPAAVLPKPSPAKRGSSRGRGGGGRRRGGRGGAVDIGRGTAFDPSLEGTPHNPSGEPWDQPLAHGNIASASTASVGQRKAGTAKAGGQRTIRKKTK